MLTLEETLELQNDLDKLCCNRPLQTRELFSGNAFYGNDKIIKLYAQLPLDYPLKLNIEHGVSMNDSEVDKVWDAELGSILPILTYKRNENKKLYEQALIKYQKQKTLLPIASPMVYLSSLLKCEKPRKREGTIFFLAHSTHTIITEANWEELALKLKKLESKYHPITVCIYWKDYLLGRHIPFQEQGFKIISAGHMFDPDFLFRFYHLCSLYHYSASNELGSNLFYSVEAGCSYFYWGEGNYHYTTANNNELKYCTLSPEEERKQNEIKQIFTPREEYLSQQKLQLVNYYLGKQYFLSPNDLQKQILDAENIFCTLAKNYYHISFNHSQSMQNQSVQTNQNLLENIVENINNSNNYQSTLNLLNSIPQENYYINYAKAICLGRIGQTEQSIASLNNLLAVNPNHQKAKILLNELSNNNLDNLLKQADQALKMGYIENSFKILNQIKALKIPTENVDYLRTICFVKMNQIRAAREALLEELRLFPHNQQAQELLTEINSKYPNIDPQASQDQEFRELMAVIRPYTMLSELRLYSLYTLTKRICQENIEGNFVECGVAGGGSTALMASVIKRYSKIPRLIYACDSFSGMPQPTAEDKQNGMDAEATGWGTGTCAAPEDSVKEICQKLGVSDLLVTVKGYFQDTLPENNDKIGNIAFLHMDGDWYESTNAILYNLYDQVVDDGLIQIDDYGAWEGCRQAINEYQTSKNLKFYLNQIDNTGYWFSKAEVTKLDKFSQQKIVKKLLNLGCGSHFNSNWTNVDFTSTGEGVIAHNLRQGIAFADRTFEVVYHSHVLEHFPKNEAEFFLQECYRVLESQGIIRVVIPDLEQIARLYLQSLENALEGSKEDADNYDWIMLEMYDQVVRNESGGEMKKYLAQNPLPNEQFIIERLGVEGEQLIKMLRGKNFPNSQLNPTQIGYFRESGEIHQWMYDRFSLSRLLAKVGFVDIKLCQANESLIPNFNSYYLDVLPDGRVRKSDSLFIEGIKPEN